MHRLCCAFWTYFRLPEPKGRTYAELDIRFEQRVSARKFKSTVIDKLDADVDKLLGEKKSGAVMIKQVGSSPSV